jgi:hypothetical protein
VGTMHPCPAVQPGGAAQRHKTGRATIDVANTSIGGNRT